MDLLQVDPLELHYTLGQNTMLPSSSLRLTNNTDKYVAFMLSALSKVKYPSEQSKGIIPPWSTWVLVPRMEAKDDTLLHKRWTDNIVVLSIVVSKDLEPDDISVDLFDIKKAVHKLELVVVFEPPLQVEPQLVSPLEPQESEAAELRLDELKLKADKKTENPTTLTNPGSIETELLEVSPLELRFPFKPDEPVWSLVNLINNGDETVHFCIVPSNPKRYMGADHWDGIVPPQSTCAVRMEMRKQQHPPQNMDQFRIFMGTKDILQHLIYADLSKHASTRDEVLRQVREDGGKAYEVSLMSVICDPEQESEIIRLNKLISMEAISGKEEADYYGNILCLDVHPTEPWIVMYNACQYLTFWNEDPQAIDDEVPCIKYEDQIYAVKFLPKMQWIVTGDINGCIAVYTNDFGEIKIFDAHDKKVESLVIHPTHPYLLSSSNRTIKLWNWDQGWECTRQFKGHIDNVLQVTINPKEVNTFASVSNPFLCSRGIIKIWNIDSAKPDMELSTEKGNCIVSYCLPGSNQPYIAIGEKHGNTKVWDLESNKYVHAFQDHRNRENIQTIVSHPTLPLLITITRRGDAYLWNSTTYRLIHVILLGDVREIKGCGFMDVKGSIRFVIGYEDIITMHEINWEH